MHAVFIYNYNDTEL